MLEDIIGMSNSIGIALMEYTDDAYPNLKFRTLYTNVMDLTMQDILPPTKRFRKSFKQDSGGRQLFAMSMHL